VPGSTPIAAKRPLRTEDDESSNGVEAPRRRVDVTGPVPGDVVFQQAIDGRFDIVVAQFHDQGHIPAKLIGRHQTVNITAGLPIYAPRLIMARVDIAWKGGVPIREHAGAIAMARRMKPIAR